ncbi:MAG TPA: pyridoxamine 5'-phosphate oxidase family protein [Jatrophihabitans sp.]|jgi:hypothetical protein|uniref:pyridoxamine 5'-phosphate oxidase family protein n=1 Tax=Jatrophihabitans sp. TaxID=1932789 RepID=UPI002E02C033|nr:pyridoxamine 5'-phosphate oxidase family protein [Jatrophihabitans sp.]
MSDRTRLSRLREKARTDRASLDALLDSTLVGHFGLVDDDGRPVVVPTAIVRDGDRVLLHGSTGSRWMRRLADGAPTCLTVTALDGYVVARSAFESSLHYRSAVLFGSCTRLPDTEVEVALDRVTERMLPGRTAEVRRPQRKELEATLVLALPIAEWSLKVSDGWPDDGPDDVAGPAWAGVVPLAHVARGPIAAPDLRAGIACPPSVTGLTSSG